MNDRCTLVCFLARCMTQKLALSAKMLSAIEELKLLNGDWRQPLVHLCSGASTCSCGGDSAASIQRRVRNCLSVLLYRNIAVPSTTRWTSMLPALSFIALWSLIHCMARDALRRAYRNPADSGLLAQDLLDIGTGNEWHAIYGARLARAFGWRYW